MKLIEAHVEGFGRLLQRSFAFTSGVQLVAGANEAGKTTLQQFLLAMLFGLKREDRKRRDYLPQYERYRPWNGGPYAGRLVYELATGERFEIQRVFEREHESVKVFDSTTGRDRSSEFTLDARRERVFMAEQLQVSRQLFEATAALGQLAARPEAGGIEALRERIQGLLDSGDEAFSAGGAIESLRALRERLGTERTPTRGIGQLERHATLLRADLETARGRHEEILELCSRRNELIRQHAAAERAWRRRRVAERLEEQKGLERRLRQAEDCQRRLQQLQAQLATFDDVAKFDLADEARAREAAAPLRGLERACQDLEQRVTLLEERDSALEAFDLDVIPAMAGLQREQLHELLADASRLREELGRFRQAWSRHQLEQRENRAVVEKLHKHKGRDWTDEDFLTRLNTDLVAARDTRIEELERGAREAQAHYAHARRECIAALVLIPLGTIAAAAGMWFAPRWLPLAVRYMFPGLVALGGLTLAPRLLRKVLASRDRAAATVSHAQRVREHQQEARLWIEEVLRRNAANGVGELLAWRREYEDLRAHAARRADESTSQELRQCERAVRERAASIQQKVGSCDLDRLAELVREPPPAARGLLPPVEEGAALPNSDDPPEVQRLLQDVSRLSLLRGVFDWLDRVAEERQRLQADMREFRTHRDARRHELEEARQALALILERAAAVDLTALATRAARARARDELVRAARSVESELAGAVGGESLEALRRRALALESASAATANEVDPDHQGSLLGAGPPELAAELVPESAHNGGRSLEQLGQEVERLAADRAQLDERLLSREREGRSPAEIELSLRETEVQLEVARRRDEALVLACETLQSVSADLHRQVAPRMNGRVAELFARLSREAHRDVRLDEDLTPRFRGDDGSLLGADRLSGGAADQLYFALRVTAGEQLARGGERLPLLLDDPFVQYDPARLDAALDLIVELASEHQVFLFTCEDAQVAGVAQRTGQSGVPHAVLHL